MFIGHFAVAFAAKKAAPKTSLGTFFLAALWLDLLWPVFLILGLEHFRITAGITKVSPFDLYDFPLSHSLVMTLAWACAFGFVYLALKGNGLSAGILSALVLSHWILDLIVHRPDLPLLPQGGPTWGWGLWQSVPGTILVEGGLFAGGILVYNKATQALDSMGRWGFWSLAAFLAFFYALTFLMPPPAADNAKFLPLITLTMGVLMVSWGYEVDKHRKAV